jgi:hypothetical protein
MKPVIPPERLAWAKMSTKERDDYRKWSGGNHSSAEARPVAQRPAPRSPSWWRKLLG